MRRRAVLLAGLWAGCRGARDTRPLIVVLTPTHANPFFKAESDAAVARATALGYATLALAHDDDVARQDRMVDTAIARGAAALVLDNADADASVSALRRALAAGIPSFLMDREITKPGLAMAQVIADGHGGAAAGARAFAARLENRGDYLELVGKESDTNARVRSRAFAETLDPIPGLRRASRLVANWSQTEAFSRTETALQRHPGLRGIIAGNDTMALGALAALRASGRRDVTVVGFDGSPDALAAIRRGELHATVLQPAALMAERAVERADRWLRQRTTGAPPRETIPCELVTAENVDQFGVFARK